MQTEFDSLFDSSKLPSILVKSKTLSKEECRVVYEYMKENKPKTMFEFGVEYGCSTRAFLTLSKWAGIDLNLHSWDVIDSIKFVSKNDFNFHLEDITGKEAAAFDKYNPDLVFLDAHPYYLTKNVIKVCLDRKIDFMCHDISFAIGDVRARERSCNFTKNFDSPKVNWELFILGEMFSQTLFKENFYEDDKVKVTCYRDQYGLAMVEVK